MPMTLKVLTFSYNQPTTAARFDFQKRYKTVFFTAWYPLSHTLSCLFVHCLRSRGGILFNPDWLLNYDGLGLGLGLVLLNWNVFLGRGVLRQWGGGCCVSGVGVLHQRGGGAASMEGCCVSEEGYYKIIWFYFLNC